MQENRDQDLFILPADDSDNDVWLAALAGVALGVLLGLGIGAMVLSRPQPESLLVEQLEKAVHGQAAAEKEVQRLRAELARQRSEVRSQKSEVKTFLAKKRLTSDPLTSDAPDFSLAWSVLVVAAMFLGLAWWLRQILVAVWRGLPAGLRRFVSSVCRAAVGS